MFIRTSTIHQYARKNKPKLSSGLIWLSSHRFLSQLGSSLFGLFLPIFLYQQFEGQLEPLLGFFLIHAILSIFLHPFGAKAMSWLGLNRSMFIGTISYACFFLSFLGIGNLPLFWVLFLANIFLLIWRTLYWPPYHTELTQFMGKRCGQTIAWLSNIASFIGIIVPLISGFVITEWGYPLLFVFAAVICLFSLIPLLYVPLVKEEYSFGFRQTYKVLFEKKHRALFYTYAAEGAENEVGLLIWPLFLFEMFKGNYFDIGFLATCIVIAAMIFRFIIGKITDKRTPNRLLHLGTGLYAFGWIVKAFVTTAIQIFIVATYHSFVMILMRIPFNALFYERAADAGHYVDEYTVLREISLNIGKACMLIFLLIILHSFNLTFAFFLAAIASIAMNFISKIHFEDQTKASASTTTALP
ncbi:hypothetical protein CO172_01890 [Candidatus Uhrbacteria bacterium CG_4_9_14_3_um_filter_36_7]|uniref:Major facilitator superfamily (MFS) profile domain-containing protein n=1 Tax=Candidatus Uhrbacteria bacterium CG_4_9_14_3_um_filter_36_7 TaxID=1975033 RepID=A0A2M7XHM0_9BACT|nr:MAG: hypothetical protein CO172_01890 [Candidatus Uhrbacteria bacterium CG_4_9_14_3_um_filter_36_7]